MDYTRESVSCSVRCSSHPKTNVSPLVARLGWNALPGHVLFHACTYSQQHLLFAQPGE